MDNQLRIQKIEKILVELRDAPNRSEPCYKCRYGSVAVMDDTHEAACKHPIVLSQFIDYSNDGSMKATKYKRYCRKIRNDDGLCGPDGLLFEPINFVISGTRAIPGVVKYMMLLSGSILGITGLFIHDNYSVYTFC